jgi:hypothetical protein
MKFQKQFFSALSVVVAGLSASSVASASSHREGPAIANDPAADNTDLYAWKCDQEGVASLCVAANYIPLELPEGGPNYNKFSDDVLYKISLTYNDEKGAPSLKTYAELQFKFKTAATPKVDVTDKVAPPGGGKEFFAQLAGEYAQTVTASILFPNYTSEEGLTNEGQPEKVLFANQKVAPPNIGQRTSTFVYGNPNYEEYAKTFIAKNAAGYKLFAGPRDDAFYVNLAQVFDLGAFVGLNELNGAPFRSKIYDRDPNQTGTFADVDPTKAPDGVAGFNVHSIVISIPLKELAPRGKEKDFLAAVDSGVPSNKTLFGVWASASRRITSFSCPPELLSFGFCRGGFLNAGPYRQVSRLGLPLINEAVIGVQDKDKYNRTTPANDVKNFGAYFLNPILVRDVEAIGGYAQLGIETVPDSLKYGRTDILQVINLNDIPTKGAHSVEIANGRTGDVLRVDVAVPSGFPNGRSLSGPAITDGKEEDVTDVELSLILTGLTAPVTDYVAGPGDGRKLMAKFPYLGTPFAGDSEGKGRPAAL